MDNNNIWDAIIVGAGPAGIFTAYEYIKNKPDAKILMVEKGHSIRNRRCPKNKTGTCVNCQPCNITTGFSGAGAFSDGKLSLTPEVGGDLPDLVGYENVQRLIEYVDQIYLAFGADPAVEGVTFEGAIKKLKLKAIQANLKLVDSPVRHLGTEKAQEIYTKLQDHLTKSGITILFDTTVTSLIVENGVCTGVWTQHNTSKHLITKEFSNNVIVATGRRGAEWLFNQCNEHDIEHVPGTVDIGVRVECRNEVMEEVNRTLYEGKFIGYPEPFKNKVRTFCQNPGGYVAQENYDHGLAVVNGHSYKEKKSNNTNFAVLCSHNFKVPFDDPIAYARKVGELTNALGNGHILVQRFGDILEGKRTWQHELDRSNIKPTIPDAVAGDITSAISYRTMISIIEFIKMLDKVVPGIASNETLLYAPELKFYSNKISLKTNLDTSMPGLYCLGDSSGWTRGLMMASVMGVIMGRRLSNEQ